MEIIENTPVNITLDLENVILKDEVGLAPGHKAIGVYTDKYEFLFTIETVFNNIKITNIEKIC